MIIYKVTGPTNKIYIGMTTKCLDKRKKSHKKAFKYHNLKFYNAIKKYGWDSFVWEELYYTDNFDDLVNKEKYFINLYKSKINGYNLTDGGEGVSGYVVPEEMKKLYSEKTKQYWNNCSKEQKQNIINYVLKNSYAGKNKKEVIDNFGNIYKSLTDASIQNNVTVGAISYAIKYKSFCNKKFFKFNENNNEFLNYGIKKPRQQIKENLNNTYASVKIKDSLNTIYNSVTEASKITKISRSHITKLLKNKKLTKSGLGFSYV